MHVLEEKSFEEMYVLGENNIEEMHINAYNNFEEMHLWHGYDEGEHKICFSDEKLMRNC